MNAPYLSPLTGEQSAMVRDNMRLVHAVLKRHTTLVRTVGHDEAVSWGYLVLCNAVRTYIPSKGAISTHFYSSFRLATMTYWERVIKREQRVRPVSDDARGDVAELLAEVPAPSDDDPSWLHADEIEAALSHLDSSEREIVSLYHGIGLRHLTIRGIAKRLGINYYEAQRRYYDAITKLRNYAHGIPCQPSRHPASCREGLNRGTTGCAASCSSGQNRMAG